MLTQLDQLINQVAEQKAAKLREEELALAELNEQRVERAVTALRNIMGPLSETLEGLIVHRDQGTEKGVLTCVEWTVASDEQRIAPITLTWYAPGYRYGQGQTEGHIEARVANGKTGLSWKGKITPAAFEEILYAARTVYADYQAAENAKREADAKAAQNRRDDEIDSLAHWVWHVGWDESYVLERVGRLKALGASDLAEQRLVEWRANVARDQAESKRREEQRAEAAAARAEYDRRIAEWRAACAVWAEQEQARLWQPWTLWKVRYVPFDMSLIHAEYDEESSPEFIQEIYTLDDPAYIASQRAVVSLRRVKGDGTVTPGYAIACFLDAEPIHYNEPTANHHRCYRAGESVVCVPPFVSEMPVAAPVRPVYPSSIELESEDSPF